MEKYILFAIGSTLFIIISWRTLFNIKNHGLYRFLSWECILWLLVNNYKQWFINPSSVQQIFAWIFLLAGLYLIIAGVILIKKAGKPMSSRDGGSLYSFEKTTELIETGIYRYIRHPMYSSLLFLTWGIFFKGITLTLFFFAALSTLFLYITAKIDERECVQYFGSKYEAYKKKTKMFVPFIF